MQGSADKRHGTVFGLVMDGADAEVERPAGLRPPEAHFGSDLVADVLRDLEIGYVAMTPCPGFRGLHDSLVNYLGNSDPRLLLCILPEHAAGIAHGHAKVTGRPMAVAIDAASGLMRAGAAILAASQDRVPVLVMAAASPGSVIAGDPAAPLRLAVKLADRPASAQAVAEALLHAAIIAEADPPAPALVVLDAAIQEARIERAPRPVSMSRFRPRQRSGAGREALAEMAAILREAEHPVILAGRLSRSETDWRRRLGLAWSLGAQVLTDLGHGAVFPTDHPLHAGQPGSPDTADVLRGADVILSLEWADLGGLIRDTFPNGRPPATIIEVSRDRARPSLAPCDLLIAGDPDVVVADLLEALGDFTQPLSVPGDQATGPGPARTLRRGANVGLSPVLDALADATVGHSVTFTALPPGWDATLWPFRAPLDHLGSVRHPDQGVTGVSVGAALALRGTGRLPVCLCTADDFLRDATALWTAVHYRIPLLMVVLADGSAADRSGSADLSGVAALARAQGATGIGPVTGQGALSAAMAAAVARVAAGGVAVVEIALVPASDAPTP